MRESPGKEMKSLEYLSRLITRENIDNYAPDGEAGGIAVG